LPLIDLISEGNIGLIKAINKFDYENDIIWNISEIIKREQEAYTGVDKISENIIEVSLFTGINYKIDVFRRYYKYGFIKN